MKFALNTVSVAIALLAVVVVVPGHAIDEVNSPNLHRFDLVIRERTVQSESKVIRATQGEQLELVWTSDEAGKLHLHGYDIEFEVGPGEPAIYTFEARATGRFPITSHGFSGEDGHGHNAMLYLEVYPD